MTTSDQYIVIGIFDDPTSADRAIDSLQRAGFSEDQIRHTPDGGGGGAVSRGIKALFSREKTMQPGDVMHDLVDMGVDPEDARVYQQEYETGHPLVSVTGKGNMQDAINILSAQGGHGPEERATGGTEYRQTERAADLAGSRADVTPPAGVPESQKMRLHAERLRAYKQPQLVGEVSIHKEVVTEQQTINVPVTREEVVVERRPVVEGAPATEEPIGEGESLRIPIREEQVRVTKEPVTTGEVEISKRQVKENRQFSDTVRREEAHLEKEGDVPIIDPSINRPPDQPQI